MKGPILAPAAASLLTLLCGCSPNYSPDTYASSAVQQASKVEQGVVVGARAVAVQASGAAGAVTGAAAGGIVGSSAPGGGVGGALTTLGGSLVGGLIGTGVERATGDTTAVEYIVRKANGDLVSVTQKDAVPLTLGTRVLVIAGSQARIVVDYTVPPEAPKAKDAEKLGEKLGNKVGPEPPGPGAQPTTVPGSTAPGPAAAEPVPPPPLTPPVAP